MDRDLLLEVGSEAIPAAFVQPALEDLERRFREAARRARLHHGEIRLFGTPRRLAILVRDVAARTEDVSKQVVGPPCKVAFDAQGEPTRAAVRFAERLGLPLDALERVTTGKGEYVAASVLERGRPATELLPEVLHALVAGTQFRKSMRWGDVEQSFARPVQWIVALLGEEVLPLVFGDTRSGATTFGHRFLAPRPLELKSPSEYEAALEEARVIACPRQRRQVLVERVQAAAREAGGALLEDPALVDEVTHLVEWPHPVAGSFEADYLDLPAEVLIQEMKSHQRYFSLIDENRRLLPRFIAVSNTPVRNPAVAVRGYERVLRARLADGRFFFDEDRKRRLEDRVEELRRVVFQKDLGSLADKVERIRALAAHLARATGRESFAGTVERAALLAKTDLVTGMVGEFPELQGVMGREYAKIDGEDDEVALAVFEHYLPRGAQDALPTRDPGALVGIADRLDTLCGIFGIGQPPTGNADPFALRRACLGIIRIVLERGYRISLGEAVDKSLGLLTPRLPQLAPAQGDAVRRRVLDFIRGRLKALWTEEHRADLVEATLAAGFDDVVASKMRLTALSALVGQPAFVPLAVCFKRVVNIVHKQGRDVAPGPPDPALFTETPEHELYAAYTHASEDVLTRVAGDDYDGALATITGLKPTLDNFFDRVMVMAEDQKLRENRIRLLVAIGGLFRNLAEFSQIHTE